MTTTANVDPFAQFKAGQREGWALFAPLEMYTTPPAAKLVRFAGIAPGQSVLDVACGTGVVAVSAARAGARVRGLDLSPVLLERARQNAQIAGVEIDFVEGDAEALPYADASFDVVLSQRRDGRALAQPAPQPAHARDDARSPRQARRRARERPGAPRAASRGAAGAHRGDLSRERDAPAVSDGESDEAGVVGLAGSGMARAPRLP